MLSPEDQLVVKESKERYDKSAETHKKNTDKKFEVLANQLVGTYGRDASKFLNSTADRLKSLLGNRGQSLSGYQAIELLTGSGKH